MKECKNCQNMDCDNCSIRIADIKRMIDGEKEYLKQMEALLEKEDIEVAHIKADAILCDLLEELGFSELIEAYSHIEKWYA